MKRAAASEIGDRSFESVSSCGKFQRGFPLQGSSQSRHQVRALEQEGFGNLDANLMATVHTSQEFAFVEGGTRGGLRRGDWPENRAASHETFDGLKELVGTNGLGKVGVHPGAKADFAVAFDCMSGHGDNRKVPLRAVLSGTNSTGTFQPVH